MFVIIATMFGKWPSRFSWHQVGRFCFKHIKCSCWAPDLCIKQVSLMCQSVSSFFNSHCYMLHVDSQKYYSCNHKSGVRKMKIFWLLKLRKDSRMSEFSGGWGSVVSGLGHLRDITAFRCPEASSTEVPARNLKTVLTQTEDGDGSCASTGLKKFVPW